MKKKGKVNPRDVPKTKLISEKKEESNEKFSNTERPSDFSKKEINKVKSRNNIDNNVENSKYYSDHLQENSQDLFKEKEKPNDLLVWYLEWNKIMLMSDYSYFINMIRLLKEWNANKLAVE